MCSFSGEISHVSQTPMSDSGHRQNWKCFVEYFSGSKKEFVLPSPGLRIRLTSEEAEAGVRKLKPQPFKGILCMYNSFNHIKVRLFAAGSVQGTAGFEIVKLNVFTLLRSRDRDDLIPVWEDFFAKFPRAEVDPMVPYDDIYGDLLSRRGNVVASCR